MLAFILISALDALWHLVIFGKRYKVGVIKVANIKNGRISINIISGIISQIFVVTAIEILVFLNFGTSASYLQAAVVGALSGILAISVYGLVNYALIKNWRFDITLLEVIWGPILGASSGLLIAYLYYLLR